MRIEVVGILDLECRSVEFRGPDGAAWGIWGERDVPGSGFHDVEIDVPEEVEKWTLEEGATTKIHGINTQCNGVTVVGRVESVGEDAVIAIKVGLDIILIEMASNDSIPEAGSVISFNTPQIYLHPYHL
ncbi:hypothetical protein OG285_22380 [Streptomyces sp. NBC_01471]|uniref:hypothetical protein n=1 Tax=Streptomyces sp. NBC_01471 TaxID=2903879 RepID=UPI00325374C5